METEREGEKYHEKKIYPDKKRGKKRKISPCLQASATYKKTFFFFFSLVQY